MRERRGTSRGELISLAERERERERKREKERERERKRERRRCTSISGGAKSGTKSNPTLN